MSSVQVHHGDSREVVKTMPDNSVDSCVCDPPYALVSIVKRFGKPGSAPAKGNEAYMRASSGFMGKSWDVGDTAFDPLFWQEVLRVLKPGGHVVAFSGTRTYHRLACAIEDAGFDIRDRIVDLIASDAHVVRLMDSLSDEQQLAFFRCIEESRFGGEINWVFGAGFPKSHDVSKGIDRALGAERAKVRVAPPKNPPNLVGGVHNGSDRPWRTVAAERGFHEAVSDEAVSDEAVSDEAVSWQGFGTALKPANEPCVLARKPLSEKSVAANVLKWGTGALNIDGSRVGTERREYKGGMGRFNEAAQAHGYRPFTNGIPSQSADSFSADGRWPANVITDGSDEVIAAFPAEAGGGKPGKPGKPTISALGEGLGTSAVGDDDSGSAARFFYSAKADAHDRMGSKHPTVKPVDLMRYLIKLVTPPGGVVLDPFAGSGSTGVAALGSGFDAILIEREAEYIADINRRIAWAKGEGRLTAQEAQRHPVDSHEDLPLFSQPASQPASQPDPECVAKSTASSPTNRADGTEKVTS